MSGIAFDSNACMKPFDMSLLNYIKRKASISFMTNALRLLYVNC